MSDLQDKLSRLFYRVTALIAIIILIDFILPGQVVVEEINTVSADRQRYYNAAQNSHYSHQIITKTNAFYVSEDFAALDWTDQQIEYSVSRIFKEVNWYKLVEDKDRYYYSLRLVSGLILPVIFLLALFISIRFPWNIDIPLFILQVLIIADLVFLLL